MQNIKESLKSALSLSFKHYFLLIKSAWLPLLIVFCFAFFFKQHFQSVIDQSHLAPTPKLLAILGKLMTTLVASLFVLMTVCPFLNAFHHNEEPPKLLKFYRKHDLPLIIESLRMFTQVILWSLLFILPGIYKQLQYTFVPFIVMFDPRYESDDSFDPLKESIKMSRGFIVVLIGITLITSSEALLDLIDIGGVAKLALAVIGQMLSLLFNSFFFFFYLARRDQLKADKA